MKIENITRDYIKYLEESSEGKINWEVWERVVSETKQKIKEYFEKNTIIKDPQKELYLGIKVFAYNNDGELIKTFNTHIECSEYLSGNNTTIQNYSKNNFIYNDFLLSREKLSKDVAFALYRYALEHNRIYKSNLDNHKKTKLIYIYNSEGKMNGVYNDLLQFCRLTNTSNPSEIRKRLLESDIIINDRLVSFSYYDTKTALSNFKNLER